MMTRSELSTRPVLVIISGRAVAFAASFAIPLVLARILTPAAFGTYKQFFLISSTVVMIGQLGMVESLLYFLPRSPGDAGRHVLNTFMAMASVGMACLGLLAFAGPRLGTWLGNDALSGLSRLLGAYVLLLLPSVMLEIVLTARKRYAGAAVTYGLSDLLRAAALVIPAVLSGRVEGLLIGAVAFAAARLVATLLYLVREFGAEFRPECSALREQLAYALPFQLGAVLAVVVISYHHYVVASAVDAASYAIYAVGCFQIPLIDLVATPAGNVMMVRMSEAIASRRPDLVLATWHDTTRRLALIFFPLVGLLLVTAREVILVLFTDRYTASVPIFMIWSVAVLFAALQTDGVLRVYARTRSIAVLNAIQLLLTAGLIPGLMSMFGLVGVVLATVLASGVVRILALVRAGRLVGATLAVLLPWRSLLAILAAAAASVLVAVGVKAHLADVAPLPLLVTTASVYAAIYGGLVLSRRLISGGARPPSPTVSATSGNGR